MFDPDTSTDRPAPALALGRRATALPPGLTECGVAAAITAIGARLEDPDLSPRDVVITAYLALQSAGSVGIPVNFEA